MMNISPKTRGIDVITAKALNKFTVQKTRAKMASCFFFVLQKVISSLFQSIHMRVISIK
ncbi:hypothetical protein PAECIP111891_01542 [Paenibacillus allorhizoplanae]|uniref:Uncharacterized protein n=1 Tax=Paenibacillus allorhizoplanae TaxID=2905648 RepID=A0ABN8G4Y2_9BACL|nr:hypothetical protein PAECIP111891_01542 [Paenibacillus allorhizoplanae]